MQKDYSISTGQRVFVKGLSRPVFVAAYDASIGMYWVSSDREGTNKILATNIQNLVY